MQVPHPLFIELETASGCNRACSWCPTGRRDASRVIDLMAWDLFTRITEDLGREGWAGEIALHNFNEPLASPRIVREYAHLRDHLRLAQLAVYTNGDFLTEEMFNALLASGVTRFRVSLYPSHAELGSRYSRWTHQRMSDWLRGKLGPIDGDVHYWRSRNAANLLCDAGPFTVEVYAPGIVGSFSDRGGTVPLRELSGYRRTAPCQVTSQAMAISYTGQVKMCCCVVPGAPGHEDLIVGNARDQPVLDLWVTARMKRLRVLHRSADWSESGICVSCRHRV